MNSLQKRQIRFTVILILLIAACIGTGLYFRIQRQQADDKVTEVSTQIENDAVVRYRALADGDGSMVITNLSQREESQVTLVFCEIADMEAVRWSAQLLTQAGLSPIFFVKASDIAAETDGIRAAVQAGYEVGICDDQYSLDGESLTLALNEGIQALHNITGSEVSTLLYTDAPSDALPAAALANGIDTIYVESMTQNLPDIRTKQQAERLLTYVDNGFIVHLQIDGVMQDNAQSIQAALLEAAQTEDAALHGTNDTAAASPSDVPQTTANSAQQSEAAVPISRIYTTQKAVAFTFSDLGSSEELTFVLNALSEVHGVGLFYVTDEELSSCHEDILRILSGGHDLGISVKPGIYTTASAQLKNLLDIQQRIRSEYGYTKELPVRPSYGSASAVLCEAAGMGGFTVISQMVSAVRMEDMRSTDASEILNAVFPESSGALQRGEIVHFQMNTYQYSKTVLGDLIKLVVSQRCIYPIEQVMEIIGNTAAQYTYPVEADSYLPEVKDRIYPGQLAGKDTANEIIKRYYGISWAADRAFLPGFFTSEIRKMNHSGLVKNDSSMIFLTFDDWGTDRIINDILNVLEKHNAKGTFFVRTESVKFNPNLLRAIAEAGHTIGCHTRTHYKLSNDVNGRGTLFHELDEQQLAAFQADILDAYQDLLDVVGDVRVDGKAALTQLFRPPTLAVGRNALEVVFDCGFSYSVSGSLTTSDYNASSAKQLYNALVRNTKSGAVFIMHMSPSAMYTAEALDMYLTYLESTDKNYQFVGLDAVLK